MKQIRLRPQSCPAPRPTLWLPGLIATAISLVFLGLVALV